MVRLGEYDLSTSTETPSIDIAVIKVARHPNYDRKDSYSDMAILYMEYSVEYSGILDIYLRLPIPIIHNIFASNFRSNSTGLPANPRAATLV